MNTMIEVKCKRGKKITGDSRGYPHSVKVLLLNEMGILSDHHRTLLDWFRTLRNDFAHKWHFQLTKERLEVHSNPTFQNPDNFFQLCVAILFDLYAMHEDIIGPALIPDAYETVTEKVVMVTEPGPHYIIPLKSDPAKITRPANNDDLKRLTEALAERERKKAEPHQNTVEQQKSEP